MIARVGQIWANATPQVRRPFYVGLAVAVVLAMLVGLGVANTESFLALPSTFEGVAASQAIWGLKPSNLLMVLPLGSFLVVLARSFIGLKAFGLFTPMLIALAFLQIGPVMGPIVLCSSVAVGMIVTPSLLKLRMTRVGFLGVLISLIVLVLVGLQMMLDTNLQVDAFPVIVCALCVERWWKQWGKDGAKPAAKMAMNTFVLAIVIEFVMVSDLAMALIEWSPLLMPATAAIAIAILGRYRGLRLSEIGRFAPIWLERRRRAKALAAAAAAEELPEGVTEDRRKGLPDTRRVPEPEPEPVPEPVALPPPLPARAVYRRPQLASLNRNHGMVLAALAGRAPALHGMWVIGSAEELKPGARRRVPQTFPEREARARPRLVASGGRVLEDWSDVWTERRPLVHNAWVIRKVEDV
ncbi:7TM domain-containing protein [Erythrobacter colymbi]|uniref:7TM domain-containing protein n=1 Tax=Erythrobacter colymbi TaxID=1161202 RepID=UPI000A3619BA|nr:7TM domain-containing protein [Erythrobacter colymbi]